jgi:mono/diheme cytochrome c family protein
VTVSYDYSGLLTSPPLHRKAVLSGNRVPDALSLEARGERNFAEKGCVNCHVDQEIPAPDLTGRKFAEEYLVMFLANPASVKKDARMPNLNLTTDDISALAAFINRERPPIRTVSQVAK